LCLLLLLELGDLFLADFHVCSLLLCVNYNLKQPICQPI
jgi:hypothetical protein